MMRMSSANSCWPSLSFRKLVLRAIEAPLMAPTTMADQRARDARIEHDRHLAGLDLARIERAPRCARRRLRPTMLGRSEVGAMRRRGEIVVALHAGAFARRSRSSRCPGSSADRSRGSRWWSPAPCRPCRRRPTRRRIWSTPFTASAAASARQRAALQLGRSPARRDRADRDREILREQRRIGKTRHICRPARRAPSPRRARRASSRHRR